MKAGDCFGNCTGCRTVEKLEIVPRIGLFCPACMAKLSQPTLYDGAVTGASLVERAAGFDAEVMARTERLRAQARVICGQ